MKYTNFEEAIRSKYRKYLLSVMKERFGDKQSEDYIKKYDDNFKRIIESTPDDGGVDSPNHHNIPEAAAVVAFYIASDHAFGAEGTVEVFKNAMKSVENFEDDCLKVGKMMFTKQWQDDRKNQASVSLKNENGFQLRFIEGKNTESFGVDYLKCPIVEMLKRENLQELQAPMCAMDYFLAEQMDFRLERSKTIGTGGDFCDFRYFKK